MDNQMIYIPTEGGELFSDDLDLISNDSAEMLDKETLPVQDEKYQQFLDTTIHTIDAALKEQHALYIENYQNTKRKPQVNAKKSPETFLYLHADESHYDIIAIIQQHCPLSDLQNMMHKGLLRNLRMKNPLFDRAICSSVNHFHEQFAKVTPHTLDSIDHPMLQQNPAFNQLAQPIKMYIMECAKNQPKSTNYWLQDNNSNEKIKSNPHNIYLCRQAVVNSTKLSLPCLYGAHKYKQLTQYEQENILDAEITKKQRQFLVVQHSTKRISHPS